MKIYVLKWLIAVTYQFAGLLFVVLSHAAIHRDVSSCRLCNPSPIMGNLDHSLLCHGKIHVQITTQLTTSNTSINYSLRCPESTLTIIETASWRTIRKWWTKGEKNWLQVTVMTAASRRQPQGLQQWRIFWSILLSDAKPLKQINVLSN